MTQKYKKLKAKLLTWAKHTLSWLALKYFFANKYGLLVRLELTMGSQTKYPLMGALDSDNEFCKLQRGHITKIRNREIAQVDINRRAHKRLVKLSRWSKYPNSFRKIRTSIMERDGWVCAACGTKKDLVVHHIDYDKKNSDPKNLITVCHTHNIRANYGRASWLAHYQNIMLEKYN